MSKVKQARWKCTRCDNGILAPTRPRKDDVRRYCLPCSEETGRLVERVAPALERQREASAAKSRERARAKAERARRAERAKTHVRLPDAAGRLVEFDPVKATQDLAKRAGYKPIRDNAISWSRRRWGAYSGHAKPADGTIHLSIGHEATVEEFVTLALHELAHVNAGLSAGHGERWIKTYAEGAKKAVGAYIPASLVRHRYRDTDPKVTVAAEDRSRKSAKPIIGKEVSEEERREVRARELRRRIRKGGFNLTDGQVTGVGWYQTREAAERAVARSSGGWEIHDIAETARRELERLAA